MARKQSQFIIMLLIVSAIGLLILAFGTLLWNNQYQKIQSLRTATIKIKNDCGVIEQHIKDSEGLKKEKQGIEQKLATLDRDVVDYKYLPSYLAQIQQAVEMTGNDLVSIQPREAKPLKSSVLFTPINASATAGVPSAPAPGASAMANKYLAQQITLNVNGTYVSSLQLLDVLRRFPKLVYLRSINLSPATKERADGMALRLETYAIIIPDQYKTPPEKKFVTLTGNGGEQQ